MDQLPNRRRRPQPEPRRETHYGPKGPDSLRNVLAHLFTARGWGRQQGRLRLEQAWQEAVGPDYAAATQLGALRRGTLEILVREAVLVHELSQFHKKRLLTAMQEKVGKQEVKDIRFRLG